MGAAERRKGHDTERMVVGLDLSITATGVALVDGSVETLATKAKDGDLRLCEIAGRVCDRTLTTDLVVIEGPVVRSSAAVIIGMVHGAIRVQLMVQSTPYAIVPPATLKKYATGKGNADKTAMAMAAYKRAGVEFADDNQCDAAWLRWAGLDALGCPAFDLPEAQKAALYKVDWPIPTRYDGGDK